ncbi:aspartate kinase [Spirochaeta cellobiosiphila]|uniref:aspartate kinase n=1 Tax=Spirochaeta cellobiosiphila TaxID=504483 RepID=UPI0004207FEB|nr:aspartate kinase [Spirochaeta cellobiosiphila]
MNKIVVKFGGSNLKDEQGITWITQRVKEYNSPLIIVVSAFFGITNFLTDGIEKVLQNSEEIQAILSRIRNKKHKTIDYFIQENEDNLKVKALLDIRLGELEKFLKGINYIGDIPDFISDKVLSYGERLSSLLLTQILQSMGIEAQEALPEDIGFYTDGEHGNATIDFEISTPLVRESLKEDKVYIIPGFYGMSQSNKVTLLGRGGSDYSAAGLAKMMGAPSLDIWKDVSGYRTADPKIVPSSLGIAELSYQEAAELSYFGAKILHPRTVEPLLETSIPIRIFNIEEEGLSPKSQITDHRIINDRVIKSVTYSNDFAILRLEGPGVGVKHGILADVTGLLNDNKINIKSVVTSQTVINIYLESGDLDQALEILGKLKNSAITKITGEDKQTLVAVVGHGIKDKPGIAMTMIAALSDQNINIKNIALGASDVASYLVIDNEDKINAVKAIHEAFFTQR